MSLNGKNGRPASLMSLGAPKKCSGEKFYFDGFFRTHQVGLPQWGASKSRIKKVNSPFKHRVSRDPCPMSYFPITFKTQKKLSFRIRLKEFKVNISFTDPNCWKCNFSLWSLMTVRCVGWSVGLSWFPVTTSTVCYTSMLLSEHLFTYRMVPMYKECSWHTSTASTVAFEIDSSKYIKFLAFVNRHLPSLTKFLCITYILTISTQL